MLSQKEETNCILFENTETPAWKALVYYANCLFHFPKFDLPGFFKKNKDQVLTGICVIRTVPCHKKLFSWKVFPATDVLFHDSLVSWNCCQAFYKGAIVSNRSTALGDVQCGLLTWGQKQMQAVFWTSPICISKLQGLLMDLRDRHF